METITLKQIITKLNEFVSDLKGKKITSFGNFHVEIENRVNVYLKSLELIYGIWGVMSLKSSIKILQLEIPNFKEDANEKQSRQGTIVDIEFVSKLNLFESSTISDCIEELKKQEHLKSIKYAEENIEELRCQLYEAEVRLEKLKKTHKP